MKLLQPEDYNHYLKVCEVASRNDDVFNNFKRIRHYVDVLEHVSYKLGVDYLKVLFGRLNNYVHRLDWESIMINDTFGNPRMSNFEQQMKKYIKLPHYNFSPTTIRYIVTGLDILEYAEQNSNKSLKIVEIGGGYGGQCKVLHDLCKLFKIEIESYTICDLREAGLLQKKFLGKVNIDAKFIVYDDVKDKKVSFENVDLLISNYCLGEITKDIQDVYINAIEKYSQMAYFLWNSKDVNQKLNNYSRIVEIPQTGTCNVIITKKY